MKVVSPMATGNGAYVVHQQLARYLNDYRLCGYHPRCTFFPPILYSMCRREADIIHTTPDYALFFSRKNIPLIVSFQNYVLDRFMADYSSPLQRVHYATDLKWFTRIATEKAAAVTAVSHYTADLVKAELGYEKPIRVIYNGVDVERFVPAEGARQGASITVLFSGNLSTRKGIQWLPGISRALNRGINILYTRGLRRDAALSALPNLIDGGSYAPDDMPMLYTQADLLLMPTVREGLSMAVLEAMACGLPVVATSCSSMHELIVEGRGGFLCEIGDTEGFANKINMLASSPDLRRAMGQFNRQRVEELFDIRQVAIQYADLFEEVIGAQG